RNGGHQDQLAFFHLVLIDQVQGKLGLVAAIVLHAFGVDAELFPNGGDGLEGSALCDLEVGRKCHVRDGLRTRRNERNHNGAQRPGGSTWTVITPSLSAVTTSSVPSRLMSATRNCTAPRMGKPGQSAPEAS